MFHIVLKQDELYKNHRRGFSQLLVQLNRAMRRPQDVERATRRISTLFLYVSITISNPLICRHWEVIGIYNLFHPVGKE